jgi:hypothetical protein
MNPTIPNPESAIITPEPIETSAGVAVQSPNSLRPDSETREQKNGPGGGGSDDSAADDARAQLTQVAIDEEGADQAMIISQQVPVIDDDDEVTEDDSVFIKKLEAIIEKNKKDPSAQVHGVASVQAEYLLKTFNYKAKAMKED